MAMPLAIAGHRSDSAPAPLAMISGMTPSTIAAVVIRMGRRRMPAAFLDGLALSLAVALQLVGDLGDQDAVLADQSHQVTRPACV